MPYLRTPNGDLCFDQRGSRADTPVLLIHGVGCQLINWPESFLNGLVEANLRVIYFDNRDCGLSFDFDAPPPDILSLIEAQNKPGSLTPPYTLSDMARDAVHLLNHIGQSGAHVIGLSMGGMIAQRLVAEHPERVFSLTSIMSTTGNPGVGQPTEEAIAALASNFLEDLDREAAIERNQQVSNLIGGSKYVSTEVGIGRFSAHSYDRAYRPQSTLRQFAAIVSDGDRRPLIREYSLPVLALHGTADPLVPHSGGEDLIENAANGRLELFEGMGHDIPEPLIPSMVDTIVEHIRTTDANR